jgi:hypothetical protein
MLARCCWACPHISIPRSVPPPRLPTPGSHRGYNAHTQGNGGQGLQCPHTRQPARHCQRPARHCRVCGHCRCPATVALAGGCLHISSMLSQALAGGWRAGVGHMLWGTERPHATLWLVRLTGSTDCRRRFLTGDRTKENKCRGGLYARLHRRMNEASRAGMNPAPTEADHPK